MKLPARVRTAFRTLSQTLCLALAVAALPAVAQDKPRSLADIKAAGELRIGVSGTYVPFSYRDNNKIVGYDADLAQAFCDTLAVKCSFVEIAWAGVIPALYAGKFDIVMSSLSYSAERVKRVGYSIPYTDASQSLLIRVADKDTIKTVEDLSGKNIGLELGSPGQLLHVKLADRIKAAHGGEGYKDVKTFDDFPAAYMALSQKRVDAVFNSFSSLAVVTRDQPGKYLIVNNIGQDNWAGIATKLENTEIIGFLNGELTRLKGNGQLSAMQTRWFGQPMILRDSVPTYN